MKILYFGRLQDIFGRTEIMPSRHPNQTVSELLDELRARSPATCEALSRPFRVALNQTILIEETVVLHDEDEVALIPPVTGG
ncbi:MoaD/ThiS family protein [Ferrovum myxofaciens]|jgi:molybdopterin converting factor small subunit|uniref:Molybdopterin synthase sulfur carrier subunit n=1 Tax=Ferrovum myxofaciens TaxID=416213 RepID=A0A9E6SWH1_9PROT|nr:MoaD/ThiS family protein [Ferrovum myxofaciens]QKE38303.1 MAG: MoaD/ThiS family protein [Ferrovum myxofaciens]QWY76038.1 MAG: MoaD/ThiS family protein [Ferrovum myxofaciens]QWY76235.1 MAG: MoaD/ThiS family protein [Ferrovum myxofaciens]